MRPRSVKFSAGLTGDGLSSFRKTATAIFHVPILLLFRVLFVEAGNV